MPDIDDQKPDEPPPPEHHEGTLNLSGEGNPDSDNDESSEDR